MVSDFIDEVDGFLQYDGTEARLYLEHQTVNNEMFITQVHKALDIFEALYPGLFVFDNAPSHYKKADDSLHPDRMNISDGGKQPRMRDTLWNGQVQQMTLEDGRQKGMKQVLIERGVNVWGKN